MKTSQQPACTIDIITCATKSLLREGIENARLEIEWFLCEILTCSRIDLYTRFIYQIDEINLIKFFSMVRRRKHGEPFQHIIGKAPFYGRDFQVNSNVFIPRPETEILINKLKENCIVENILDIGTGSGCIAITCSLENLAKQIYATDISLKALDTAHENVQKHGTYNVQLFHHNFLKDNFNVNFDVVVSNPPYISLDEINSLQIEVKNFDPYSALTDGYDGFVFYKHFANKFESLVKREGYMLLEIDGKFHKNKLKTLFEEAGLQTIFYKDLQGSSRVIKVFK